MYPYPELTWQLQFLCSPAEYQAIKHRKQYWNNPDFWTIMPHYHYADCPLCGQQYVEAGNTYGWGDWGYTGLAPLLCPTNATQKSEEAKAKHCKHFLGVRHFINLHGVIPYEIQYFSDKEGEVPFVDRHFFQGDMRTYVVLHALPICRIENEAFVPTYTVFVMTYFTELPDEVIRRNYKSQEIHAKIDPEYWPTLVQRPEGASAESFDLQLWVAQGKLGWLDFTQPDLPLRLGNGETLPAIYRNIDGRRKSFIWRNPQRQQLLPELPASVSNVKPEYKTSPPLTIRTFLRYVLGLSDND
jgi:hypothetical protein